MKTVRLFVLIAIFSSIIFSCNHGFLKDPRLYNPKKTQQGGMSAAEEPELVQTGGVDPFDDIEKWYNKSDSNGDDTNPEKGGFPHTDFATMSLVGTYFNGDNVPVYAMQQENVWVSNDASKGEFVHAKAPNTTGQGYSISNVYWYQYQGKNPVYAADGNYNQSLQVTAANNPKLSRFYFYRFTGDTLSPSLDNFLFAVDTYSKLMFAFAYPTKTEAVFGNNVPKAWGPIDGNAFLGTNYQFYMYDPVGYVEKKDDGGYNVVLYQWFQNNLAKGVYQPTLGGIDAKSQGDAYVELARKSPDGAGKSPFNNQSVDFFAENMKLLRGAVFYRREQLADGGNGLVLYKYTVDGEATKITRTAESWRGLPTDTSLDLLDYTIGEGKNATSGSLKLGDKELTFELSDETRCITITGEGHTTEVAVKNFTDLGPEFIERVKNDPFYKSTDGKITYEFKDNGKTLIFTYDGTIYNYTYVEPRNDEDKNCAVYSSEDALLAYAGFELTENDTIIKTSRTSGAWTGTFAWDMTHAANLTYKKGATFQESVAGKSFSYRGKNDVGYDLALRTLEFSTDGTSAKLYETKWGSVAELIKENLTVTDGSSATDGMLAEQAVSITITGEGQWKLVYEGNTYYIGYNDPGPSFVNRVQDNPTFVSQDEKTIYRFSNYGRTLRMSYSGGWLGFGSFDYTYHYVQEADSDRSSVSYAVYKAENGIAGFSYAGFELSNSDMQIRATNTSAAGANLVDWLIMTYDAMRTGNTGSVPTEEDLETFYTFMKGKTFKTRNAENDAPGLELLTWQIDDTGKAGSLKKQIWLSNSETIEVTIPEGKLVALDKNRGTFLDDKSNIRYDFSYDEEAGTFLVRTSGTEIASSTLSYSANYEDKGPGFVNRVKGKTYSNSDGSDVYKFSADGKILTMNGYDYSYCNDRDAETGKSRAVYKWNGAQFYGLELSDNDKTIKMTSSSSYDVPMWIALGWEAYLTDGSNVGGTGQSPITPAPSPEVIVTFQSQVQGKTFSVRKSNTNGPDLSLLTLQFNSDGTSATLTETIWGGSTSTGDSLKVADGSSAKEGKIGEKSATISTSTEGKLQVVYDGNTYVYGYTDPTPSFVNRVKGKTYRKYASTGELETEYKFSADGTQLDLIYTTAVSSWGGNKGTYTYAPDKDKGSKGNYVYAVYGNYYVDLTDGNNGEKDAVVRMENTTAASDYWAADMEYEAYLVDGNDVGGTGQSPTTPPSSTEPAPSPEVIVTFQSQVQGKTFSVRKSNTNGPDLSLLTLQFNSDGTSATLTETIWGGSTSTGDSLKVADGSSAKEGKIGEKSATISTSTEGKLQVVYDGNTYVYGYTDPTPSFVNRVQDNPTFVSSDGATVYRFSNFGETMRMTWSGGDYIYTFDTEVSANSDTCRAVYKTNDAWWGFSAAGFELSNSDNVIKSTHESAAGAGTVVWNLTYEATRNGDSSKAPTPEDLDAFYKSLQGKTFKVRNVENGVAGLELLTWTFDSNRGGTLKKEVWGSASSSDPEVTIPSGGLSAQSKTTGFFKKDNTVYKFSYDEGAQKLRVESNGTSYDFMANYDDKGPAFINRVKGKTYVGTDGTYVFDSTGKSFTYDGYTYTWAGSPSDDEHYTGSDGTKYVYTTYAYKGWTTSNYFLDLQEVDGKKDFKIRFETSSLASSYSAAVMGYEATLSSSSN